MAISITKKNWVSNFTLVGKAKINQYTFTMNENKSGSNWVRNQMSLKIDCGEECGSIKCEMQGGYDKETGGIIYAHGKNEDGTDDFNSPITINWEDRFNESILKSVGDACFIKVSLEKYTNGNNVLKKFISPYDAIKYIQEHLENDTEVIVRGNIRYSIYNDNVYVNKNITSIFLYEDTSKFKPKYPAMFTQSVLLGKDCVNIAEMDKSTGLVYVNGKVLDYAKEYKGVEIKDQIPINRIFSFYFNTEHPEKNKTIYNKLFKIKKGYNQINFVGKFVGGGGTINVTVDDIPDDIKELIDAGVFKEEDALSKCAINTSSTENMILIQPNIRKATNDSPAVLQIYEEAYTEDDLILDFLENDNNNEDSFENISEDMDWLNDLN